MPSPTASTRFRRRQPSVTDDALKARGSCDLRSAIGVGVHRSAYAGAVEMLRHAVALLNERVSRSCAHTAEGALSPTVR